jgi:hypothetical protein
VHQTQVSGILTTKHTAPVRDYLTTEKHPQLPAPATRGKEKSAGIKATASELAARLGFMPASYTERDRDRESFSPLYANRFDVAEQAASREDYKEQKRNLLSCVETYTCAAEEAAKG